MGRKIKYIVIAILVITTCMSFLMKTTYAANDDDKVKKAIEEMGKQNSSNVLGTGAGLDSRNTYPNIKKEAEKKDLSKIVEWWNLIKDKSDKYPGQWACLNANINDLVKDNQIERVGKDENGKYASVKLHESKTNLSAKEIMKQSSSDIDKLNETDLDAQIKTLEKDIKDGNLSESDKKKYEEKIEELKKKKEELEKNNTRINGETDGKATPKATGNFSRFASTQKNKEHTPDEIITEADKFVEDGAKEESPLETSAMKNVSNTIYNIFLAAGTAASVIVGMILGIKFMLANVEGKAEVKQAMIPYIIGCVVLFGAFGIWKIVLILMSNL